MSFYSARNINVTLNDAGVFAKKASLSSNAVLSNVHHVGESVSEQVKADSPVETSLNLVYLLTGVDPIKSHIISGELPIKGDFGGFILNSGYLQNYSFSASPYQPVEITASIRFFEPVKGSFSPSSSSLEHQDVLMFSDMSIDEENIIEADELLGIGYSYSTSVKGVYSAQELGEDTSLHRVVFGERDVSVDFTTNKLNTHLSETGIAGNAIIKLANAAGSVVEKYYVDGFIESQETLIESDSLLTRQMKLTQAHLGGAPSITSVTPDDSVPVGNTVVIQGENFIGVDSVELLDQELDFTVEDNSSISFIVPSDAHVGPLSVRCKGGTATYSGISVVPPTS